MIHYTYLGDIVPGTVTFESWMLELLAWNAPDCTGWSWGPDDPDCVEAGMDVLYSGGPRQSLLAYVFLQQDKKVATAHVAVCVLRHADASTAKYVIHVKNREQADAIVCVLSSNLRSTPEATAVGILETNLRILEVPRHWRDYLADTFGTLTEDPFHLREEWKNEVDEEDLTYVLERATAAAAIEDCIDRWRVAYIHDACAVARFADIERGGCCGSLNLLVVAPSLRPYLVGFNYGH